MPVYFATKSRWIGFGLAAASGLAEPLGVFIARSAPAALPPGALSSTAVEMMLAAVAGIMTLLALNELLPLALEHAGQKRAGAAMFGGMALMAFVLCVLGDGLA